MKILLTGGGSAGHFYPLIAIAEEVGRITAEEKLLRASLYYMSTTPYDKKMLSDNDIEFRRTFAGKRRLYFSLFNIIDVFKMAVGVLKALWSIYFLYPDVVISKGGYASIPAVFAARILKIPLIIHESDSVPGRANQWAARFALRIAISWPEAATYFKQKEKVAVTGQPVRRELLQPAKHGAHEYLNLTEGLPVIFIMGGSQGAKRINETVLDILPELVMKYQIIHQTGSKHIESIKQLTGVILAKSPHKERYKPFGYLNSLALRMSAGAASLIISRAGSALFEIASWGLPSILIPIRESNGDHQRRNAFNYARGGACVVIEEENLTPHVLLAEIDRLMEDGDLRRQMSKGARKFFKPGAAEKIAREAISIALEHER